MVPVSLLSCPYSDPSEVVKNLRFEAAVTACAHLASLGKIVICPVVMNHPVEQNLRKTGRRTPPGFWVTLEQSVAAICDEIIVLKIDGWQTSKGVMREIALFRYAEKPGWELDGNLSLSALVDVEII
ncbi:MAG: hypothetical protein ABS69_01805 [Nitrosomonadales bacterium SCN 54-20]|nr:MAG: hypothetical protein ABS69_01805 [Nitrosomonadales bacterium SCN 54-20]